MFVFLVGKEVSSHTVTGILFIFFPVFPLRLSRFGTLGRGRSETERFASCLIFDFGRFGERAESPEWMRRGVRGNPE